MYPLRAAKDKLQGQKEGTYTGMMDVLRKACAYCSSCSSCSSDSTALRCSDNDAL